MKDTGDKIKNKLISEDNLIAAFTSKNDHCWAEDVKLITKKTKTFSHSPVVVKPWFITTSAVKYKLINHVERGKCLNTALNSCHSYCLH